MKFKKNPAVTETKVVEVSPATYTITLNEEEAAVIASLIGKVGGHPGKIMNVVNRVWEEGFMNFIDSPHYVDSFLTINNEPLAYIKAPNDPS